MSSFHDTNRDRERRECGMATDIAIELIETRLPAPSGTREVVRRRFMRMGVRDRLPDCEGTMYVGRRPRGSSSDPAASLPEAIMAPLQRRSRGIRPVFESLEGRIVLS